MGTQLSAKKISKASGKPSAKPSADLSSKRVAVLGAGKIGGILLRAFLQKKLVQPKNARATVKHAERAAELSKSLGVSVGTDNRAAARGADIVLIAVKPLLVAEVAQAIRGEVGPNTLVISVAASVPTSHLEAEIAERCACDSRNAEYAVRDRRRNDGFSQGAPRHRGAHGNRAQAV